jgi:capsular polysaccharide biosynthesis protein
MNLKTPLIETGRRLRSGAARMAAWLPGSSIRFGPPRREATTSSLNDPSALIKHPILPARTSLRSIPELADPPLDQWMRQPRPADIKEIFVAELPQGRYWGHFHGYIVDRNDTLLTDLSPTFTPPDQRHDGLDQFKLPPLRELRGTVAIINTLFSNNFHHWLLDTTPRFEWLRRAGWKWGDIDHFILSPELLRFHLETLAILGIDKSKVICSGPQLHVRADILLAPCHSEPAQFPLEYDYTPEGLRFVHDIGLKNNPFLQRKHPARIIISREKAGSRRLVQAERANQALFAQGFEKVLLEDYSLQEQAAFFHQADCIVMPTGGNLANFVFCRPGTVAIELFSKDYIPPFTYSLMDGIGLRYYGVVADKVSRPYPEARLSLEDIDVDPDRLAEIVHRACSH